VLDLQTGNATLTVQQTVQDAWLAEPCQMPAEERAAMPYVSKRMLNRTGKEGQ